MAHKTKEQRKADRIAWTELNRKRDATLTHETLPNGHGVSRFTCAICKEAKAIEHPPGYFGGTGYAFLHDGIDPICYPCAADDERAEMIATGKGTLYLSKTSDGSRWTVGDWAGELTFTDILSVHKRGHNWRNVSGYTVEFYGPDGYVWHGINLGDNDILRCKRLKVQGKPKAKGTFSAFLEGYLECAAWLTTEYRDGKLVSEDARDKEWTREAIVRAATDCLAFFGANYRDLEAYAETLDYGKAGGDFFLTRNGHGAGFWDRDLGELGVRLTAAAEAAENVTTDVYRGRIEFL